jgi:hypothetical protein
MSLKVGDKIRWLEQLAHVRGFVDNQVVFKIWSRYKRRWNYHAEPVWMVEHFLRLQQKGE